MNLLEELEKAQNELNESVLKAVDKFHRTTGMYVPVIEVQHLDVGSLDGKSWIPEKVRPYVTSEPVKHDDE